MRKRKNQIVFFLDDKELKELKKQVDITGLSISVLIRKFIMNNEIKQRPPKDYNKIIYEVAKIGNNINKIAKKANINNSVAKRDAETVVILMKKCYEIVKDLE